jgi:ATP-dependent Clp protease ATP-binding subunit ClpC
MSYALDPAVQTAVDTAKRSVPEDEELGVVHLLAALYHGTDLASRFPQLAAHLSAPQPLTAEPGKRRLALPLSEVLAAFAPPAPPASPDEVFTAIVSSRAGREALLGRGVAPADLDTILASLSSGPGGGPSWKRDPDRPKVIEALSAYGRTLTAIELPESHLFGVESVLRDLMKSLIQRKQRGVLLVGPPGVGKSAVVHEFARRITVGDPIIHPRIRDIDIFELSPAFLKAGASVVGQFEERIKGLLEILTAHPQVVVFVDEVHALLQSEMHVQTPFSGASAEFKKAVGNGDISLIGCTTLTEYRHYIEADRALADRFSQVRIDPPSADETVQIMQARLPSLRRYYHELRIPDEIVPSTVKLAEDHLLGRYQPRKSIRLLDQACAWCLVQDPPFEEVTEAALRAVIEAETGQRLVETHRITSDELFERLTRTIIGQDGPLRTLADAIETGLGSWVGAGKGPRGNLFFAGPTGVGKTETAKLLAEAIGGSGRALIRIDCNTLQGSGWDSREAINTLLGAPPGYIGYVRGEGGVLSRVRDTPECIVLFDEIEKADPGVGKLLLQILDEGLVEDTDGNPLDFRRAFLIFTSNAGVTYGGASDDVGFRPPHAQEAPTTPAAAAKVTRGSVMDDLRRRGFPQEFLGRNFQWIMFGSLDVSHAREVLRRQLEELKTSAAVRPVPIEVRWDPGTIDRMTADWEPQFGVRHLTMQLRNRVIGQLSGAEARGELEAVTAVELRPRQPAPTTPDHDPDEPRPPTVFRHREGDTLVIEVG